MLTLALLIGVLGGACRTQPTPAEVPEEDRPRIDASEQVDAPAVCTAGCERLEQCVPQLAGDFQGDPLVVAERLARECDSACESFADPRSALAVRDCLTLNSCTSFWGCVGAGGAHPWLAAVAPVGERSCENLCSQASACAIARVCEDEGKGKDPEQGKQRPGKAGKGNANAEPESASPGRSSSRTNTECTRDEVRRSELDERCLMQCKALPETSRARIELIGCIDHVSCGGLLGCLEGWTTTNYDGDATTGPGPGIDPTCDGFCSRAILCGAADEQVELGPAELEELKRMMTSTYVECAVQCKKDLEVGGAALREAYETCTVAETCELFTICAGEV